LLYTEKERSVAFTEWDPLNLGGLVLLLSLGNTYIYMCKLVW